MGTASIQLVVFGLAVALISNFSRSPVWRSLVLFTASLLFIGLLEHRPMVILPLTGFLLLGYTGLVLLQRRVTRSAAFVLCTVVFVYIWLKKYSFIPDYIFLQSPYFTLGLSYIFFRVLHLLIDARDGGKVGDISLGAYLLYTLNFTTFISGPIQRYDEFARDQFTSDPLSLGPAVIGLQLERIVRGFFKVNVLGMLLEMVQADALAQVTQAPPAPFKFFAAFSLVLIYPLFLYCNFSGYIDIVIGLARLMRVRVPENFDRPFSASCVIDFWNRWHITLSNWLKAYVFNPLLVVSMRRFSSVIVQPFLAVFCFFVTFFLIGLWHGRTSEFIFFGIVTGGGMSINKLWQLGLARVMGGKGYRELAKNFIYAAFGRGLNYIWFAFTLLWFWSDWKQIGTIFSSLSLAEWLGLWMAAWLAVTVVLAVWEWLRAVLLSFRISEGPVLVSRYALVVYSSALGWVALVLTVLLNQPAPGIVYKAF
jgi:alginate O-acetyltransferase complex protein AlgI